MVAVKMYLKTIGSFMVVGNLVVSGLVCVYAAMRYMRLEFSGEIGLLCMGIIGSIYLFNRITDFKEDVANNVRRLAFLIHRRIILAVTILIAVVTLGYCLYRYRVSTYEAYLLALGLLYSFPLIPVAGLRSRNKIRFIRLKEIPLIKNILVALLWSVSIFLIPILHCNQIPNVTFMVYLLIVAQIIATLANTIDSDILDEAGDRLAGVRSLPVLIGARGSYMVIYLMTTLWLLTVLLLHFSGIITGKEALFFTALALWPYTVMLLRKAMKWSNDFSSIAGDLQLMLFGGGILWLSHI